jgi:hypothetical protein
VEYNDFLSHNHSEIDFIKNIYSMFKLKKVFIKWNSYLKKDKYINNYIKNLHVTCISDIV